jgi:hypothetical protein
VSANFNNKNVGSGKTVTILGIAINSGADAGNYVLGNTSTTALANITARSLTVSATGINRVYDGTTVATVTLSDNRVSGDVFTAAYTSAAFSSKNVGTGKAVSVTGISISGVDASNYNLASTTASTTADITPRNLTVSAAGINRVYDGTTIATVTLSTDKVSGDSVIPAYTSASFADKNVGTAKTVSVTGITISGTDAANYNLTSTAASTTANITARPVTVTADPKSKIIGAIDPPLTYQVTGGPVVTGDTFSGSLTRAPGEAVGVYPITQGTLTLGANYNITFVGSTLTIGYKYTGFSQPIDNGVLNKATAGQTIPVKWRLTDANGVGISNPASFVSLTSNTSGCSVALPTDDIETYSGNSGLQYLGDGNWQYNWKTPKTYASQCRTMFLNLSDIVAPATTPVDRTAQFQFK